MINGFIGTILTGNVGISKQPWRRRWQLSSWRKATGKYAGYRKNIEHWFLMRVACLIFICCLHGFHTFKVASSHESYRHQGWGSLGSLRDSWGSCETSRQTVLYEVLQWTLLEESVPLQVTVCMNYQFLSKLAGSSSLNPLAGWDALGCKG